MMSVSREPAGSDVAKVAVLLAAFNGMAWLDEQLASILNQEGVLVTVFISVDQSSDGTEAWFDLQAARDVRLRVLPHGRVFGSAAPNFFRLFQEVDLSEFDYVCLSDQDDIWSPEKLSRATQVLAQEGVVAYSSNAIAFWEDGRTALVNKSQAQVRWDYLFEAAGPGCTYVFKASLAWEIKQFIASHGQEINQVGLHDWLIYAYVRSRGYRWTIDHQALIYYRQHSQNQVGVNAGLKGFMRRASKVSSGWALTQAALIARMIGADKAPFVRSWIAGGSLGLLRLSLDFWNCRRRFRDKFIFLFSCLYLALFGKGL
ncbi:glycosyltransferase [Polynucleobacter sp. 31A-FELB]|uniref:glycosyltransferase n=1 Tax=Polynucleobacter sp. 31A-FELB TaxID=2689096 RepID=UPI001C0C5585|nr:glycosyltransferase [Polynucleobacter sp. 31A-FELB]